MGNKGYIKLHRQIQDCWIWSDGEKFDKAHAFIDLLISANHKDKKVAVNGIPQIITRGQFLTSEIKLAQRWGWDRKTVHKFLEILENDEMVTLEHSYIGTTVTIVNYRVYQDSMDNQLDSGMDNRNDQNECSEPLPLWTAVTPENTGVEQGGMDSQMDNQTDSQMDSGMDTNKNDKEINIKEKNNKKERADVLFARLAPEYDFSEQMMQSLTEWFEYKTERKDKFVESGMRKTLTQIQNKITEYGEKFVIDVINNSMAHSWSGMIWDSVKPTQRESVQQGDLSFLNTDWHTWDLYQWSKAKALGKATDDDFRRVRKEVRDGTV